VIILVLGKSLAEGSLRSRPAIKVEAYILLIRKVGERALLEAWTNFHFGVARLIELPGVETPVLIRTERYLKVDWILHRDEQLNTVLSFLDRTRRELFLDDLLVHYYPITFCFPE